MPPARLQRSGSPRRRADDRLANRPLSRRRSSRWPPDSQNTCASSLHAPPRAASRGSYTPSTGPWRRRAWRLARERGVTPTEGQRYQAAHVRGQTRGGTAPTCAGPPLPAADGRECRPGSATSPALLLWRGPRGSGGAPFPAPHGRGTATGRPSLPVRNRQTQDRLRLPRGVPRRGMAALPMRPAVPAAPGSRQGAQSPSGRRAIRGVTRSAEARVAGPHPCPGASPPYKSPGAPAAAPAGRSGPPPPKSVTARTNETSTTDLPAAAASRSRAAHRWACMAVSASSSCRGATADHTAHQGDHCLRAVDKCGRFYGATQEATRRRRQTP